MKQAGGDFQIVRRVLRLEQVVSATATQYVYNVYENAGGTQRVTERRLSRNDAFAIEGLALWFYKAAAGSEGQAQPYPWPNPTVFSGAGEAAALMAFYNGLLTLRTTPVDRIISLDTQMLQYRPGFVPEAGAFVGAGGPSWGPSTQERGFFPIIPEPVLDGQMDNQFTLTLGTGTPTAGATTPNINVSVLAVLGYQVINGANRLGSWYTR